MSITHFPRRIEEANAMLMIHHEGTKDTKVTKKSHILFVITRRSLVVPYFCLLFYLFVAEEAAVIFTVSSCPSCLRGEESNNSSMGWELRDRR
jgi:hypothetical protein